MGKIDSYLEFLLKEAQERHIKIPTRRTLAIYGLSDREWLILLHKQRWGCGICGKENALWNIDHQHVHGWKRMAPRTRVKFVRGILCWKCNKHSAPSNMTSDEAFRLAEYLQAYESRRRADERVS